MSYIGAEPDGQGKAQRFTFTASGGETVVSADDDGIPIGYTAGQVSVYLNGVKLVVGTDCIATNGSTITGLSALAASDVVEVVALSIFSATTVEGTALISTGETGGTKFLREDGDGTSSWQTVPSTFAGLTDTTVSSSDPTVSTNPSAVGHYWVNSTSGETYICTDATTGSNVWVNTGGGSGNIEKLYVTATGPDSAAGTIDGDYKYHVFNATKTGTAAFVVSNVGNALGSNTLEYLVIAGGGGGGTGYAGGGGAGGYRTATGFACPAVGNHNVTVGGGGAVDTDGDDSVFDSITSTGGGAGGNNEIGHSGGSGGGGGTAQGASDKAGGASSPVTDPVQGYAGGIGKNTGSDFKHAGGGGGGASEAGSDGNTTTYVAGAGGDGRASSITGSAVTRGGGGGGGADHYHSGGGGCPDPLDQWIGVGGTGGGGSSGGCSASGPVATAGTANTGGGGGGTAAAGQQAGSAGGSGVVILRYKFQN